MPLAKPVIAGVALALILSGGGTGMAQDEGALTGGGAFFDGFDRLDRQRWFISDGWSNGAHQNCTWSRGAVSVSGGTARLQFQPATQPQAPHLCSEIQTKMRYGHGTYEARLKTDRGSGLNAAFFTYIGPVHKEPHEEIDVEILTRDPSRVQFNTYHRGVSANAALIPLPQPTDAGFQTFAFRWQPDRIEWFVNGVLMHEETQNIPDRTQKIYFSHWGTDTLTDWMGVFAPPAAPLDLTVDWVAFTPLGAECQFPESLLCSPP